MSTLSAMPNEGTLKLFDSLLDKMSCFNFFSVMKAVFNEFIFSIHILDNIFLIQSLYARNIYIHWNETTLRSFLGDVCAPLLGNKCDAQNGHEVRREESKKYAAYNDIKVYPIPPIITKKDIEILSNYGLKSFINYEFKDAETALFCLIDGLSEIDLNILKDAKTTLDYMDEKQMKEANKKNSNQTVPDPIRLTYYSKWTDVKSFVDCGDIHLGKVRDDAMRKNCNIKRSMMDEYERNQHKLRTSKLVTSTVDEEINSENVFNEIVPQYKLELQTLFGEIKQNEILKNNYIIAVIRDLKLKEILDITINSRRDI